MLYTPQKPAAPTWVEILPKKDGRLPVRMEFAPISASVKKKARFLANEVLGDREGEEVLTKVDLIDLGDAFSKAIIRLTLRAWEGIGDDKGPWPVTPETVSAILEDDELFEAIDAKIIMPLVEQDRAKNGSSAFPSGTGKAATRAKTIAGSAAVVRKATGDAKPARMSSTNSQARKAKQPGKR